MNAVEEDARTQLHSCRVHAHTEGVEFVFSEGGERKGTYRKGPHIHVTGKQKSAESWAMFNCYCYLFTRVSVFVRGFLAV